MGAFWARKSEFSGMQRLSGELERLFENRTPPRLNERQVMSLIGIELVAHHRMPGMGGVHPNLMGATGDGFGLHKREPAALTSLPTGEGVEAGVRSRPGWVDRLPEPDPVGGKPAHPSHRGVDDDLARWKAPEHDCLVALVKIAGLHAGGEPSGGLTGFGDEHQA